jgi:hypothetical protein
VPLNLDTILWLTGVSAEAVVVLLCIRGRLFSGIPVFSAYMAWSLFIDLFVYYLRRLSPTSYFQIYFPQMVIDSAFQFAILVELGWAILRPLRASLPKRSVLYLALIVIVAGALIWPLAGLTLPPKLTHAGRFFVQLQQTFAVLRIAIFLGLAGFSQLLSIGWRNRELQIATGLGFYSMFSLAVSLIHAHQAVGPQYEFLDQLISASWDCSLVYWIVSFSQQESERQEFTPQMRSFLLSVTGAARGTRVALAESGIETRTKVRK